MKVKVLMAGLLALGLCACTSDDNLVADGGGDASSTGEKVYMQFTLQMPTTRTNSEGEVNGETISQSTDDYVKSDAGIEYGQDYENTVNTLFVVLTQSQSDGTEKVLATSERDNNKVIQTSADDEYVVTFDSDAIANLSEEEKESVNVFVFCNTTNSVEVGSTTALDEPYTLISATDGTPWDQSSGFFMSNAKKHTIDLPNDFNPYTSVNNPFDMGEVTVERSMARFDYKDGADPTTPYTYTMEKATGDGGNGDVTIQLTHIALVNLSNSFYYLRRVSKDGTSTGDDFAYCGTEWYSSADETGNYVVDTDANDKENYGGEDMSANFEYYMFGTEGNPTLAGLDWTKLSDLEDSDNDNSWNSGNTYGDYHIWRYATENTIPAAVKNQKNGISTGIVFKGVINLGNLKSDLVREDDADGIIYVYENYLLGTWSRVEEIAENEEGKYDSYGESFCRSVAVALEEITEKENEGISKVQALADAGFTGYAPNDDGEYEVYYYYWNRHNDNGKEGVMGPMKFGVVRNNVYKLSVTDIALFGHPDPDNPDNPDPDRPDPDEPDEELKYYFKLEVQILPWVVRVNDITF